MSESGAVDTSSPRESFSKLLNGKDAEPALTGASILLVDDKPELLNSLYQLILLHGYQPDKALGGQEALDRLAEKSYDVVLLDLIMPGINGHDVLEYAADGGPDKRCYRVECSKIVELLPAYKPAWTVRLGVEELYAAYESINLKHAQKLAAS